LGVALAFAMAGCAAESERTGTVTGTIPAAAASGASAEARSIARTFAQTCLAGARSPILQEGGFLRAGFRALDPLVLENVDAKYATFKHPDGARTGFVSRSALFGDSCMLSTKTSGDSFQTVEQVIALIAARPDATGPATRLAPSGAFRARAHQAVSGRIVQASVPTGVSAQIVNIKLLPNQ
jgi:hypothetical protein